jgi:hypothetical protein
VRDVFRFFGRGEFTKSWLEFALSGAVWLRYLLAAVSRERKKEYSRRAMRMWNVDPKVLCTKHLLGEHVELHMFVGSIVRRKNIAGFIETGLVEVHSIVRRHGRLVREMERRGFKHKSPLPRFKSYSAGRVDRQKNLQELSKRCPECRKIIADLMREHVRES